MILFTYLQDINNYHKYKERRTLLRLNTKKLYTCTTILQLLEENKRIKERIKKRIQERIKNSIQKKIQKAYYIANTKKLIEKS